MAEAMTILATVVGLTATLFGIITGWRQLQQSRRRLHVRLEPLTTTVTIVVLNPSDTHVPVSGVRMVLANGAILPLDSLTEGHFPLSLPPGTTYKLPIRREALVSVLERNGVGSEMKLRAEALLATGKTRKSPPQSLLVNA